VCAQLGLTGGTPVITTLAVALLSSSCEANCFTSSYASETNGVGSAAQLGPPAFTLFPECEASWKQAHYARLYLRLSTDSPEGLASADEYPPWMQDLLNQGPVAITSAAPVEAQQRDADAQAALQKCSAACQGGAPWRGAGLGMRCSNSVVLWCCLR
jgi:hypothetical protein